MISMKNQNEYKNMEDQLESIICNYEINLNDNMKKEIVENIAQKFPMTEENTKNNYYAENDVNWNYNQEYYSGELGNFNGKVGTNLTSRDAIEFIRIFFLNTIINLFSINTHNIETIINIVLTSLAISSAELLSRVIILKNNELRCVYLTIIHLSNNKPDIPINKEDIINFMTGTCIYTSQFKCVHRNKNSTACEYFQNQNIEEVLQTLEKTYALIRFDNSTQEYYIK